MTKIETIELYGVITKITAISAHNVIVDVREEGTGKVWEVVLPDDFRARFDLEEGLHVYARGAKALGGIFADCFEEWGRVCAVCGKWLHDQSQFDNYYLKVMDVNDTTWEMCPHCEHEVELLMKWEVQRCPVCGKFICPCSMCSPYYECAGCPLDEMCEKINRLNERTCE